ncbi:MAG: DUF3368 domain-containing protein [Anaerolineae bacterium]|nr:DUF3368 domain-containing protein [Anaerolineae bacterium]
MIVISNTSPLTNLAAIGHFDLLHRLYAKIHIPEAVWDELNEGGVHWPGRDDVAVSNWVERHTVQNQALVTALQYNLDRGESESIALALELGADLVLLDEREGRHTAQRMGLRVIGVVGVILEGKATGALDEVRPFLDDLRQVAGFYLSEAVYRHALGLAGEDSDFISGNS